MRRLVSLAAIALLSACGFDDRVAGGTSSEVPNALQGRILDDSGKPVAGCAVRLASSASWADSLARPDSTKTDSDGRWSFTSRPPGSWTLSMRTQDGGSIAELSTTSARTPGRQDTLRPWAWIRGSVVGARGLSRVAVLGTALATRTDINGSFLLGPVPAGNLRVMVLADSAGTPARRVVAIRTTPGDTGLAGVWSLSPWLAEEYGSWPQSRTATLDLTAAGAGITGDHVGFPIPVRLDTLLDVKTVKPGEIRFDDGKGLHLPFLVETWDAATGKALVWVRLDTANGSSDKHSLRLHWGKPGALAPWDMPPVFDGGNGFVAAWHLGDALETSRTSTLVWSSSTSGPGITGGSQTLQGAGSFRTDSVSLGGSRSWTVSLWVKFDKKPSGEILLAGFSDGPDSTHWGLSVRDDLVARVWSGADTSRSLEASTPLALNTWIHLAASFDAASSRIGLAIDTTDLPRRSVTLPAASSQRLRGGSGLHGSLDEIRLADPARAPEWSSLERQVSTNAIPWLRWK